jgi:CheY-like chemotaxis protein
VSADAPPTSGAQATRETVLVVEDQVEVLRLTARLLRRLGYTPIEARSGEEALAVAAAFEGDIDVLVTDVVMPGLSGDALADQLTAARPGLRVVFISGNPANRGLRAVVAGAAGFLAKPFTSAALEASVREALRARAA